MRIPLAALLPVVYCQIVIGADHAVVIHVDKTVGKLSTSYHGVNYCAFWDNAQGSAGSRNALKRAGVQILRYPGGVPGNYLDWAKTQGSWAGTNTDSLWNYAKSVGAKLMLQTNPYKSKINDAGDTNDPSGAHAAEWVTYCKSKGIDAPFWEIGNEPEGEKPISWNYPTMDSVLLKEYLDRFNEQAAAIHAANPDVTVMGPASANTWYWWAQGLLEVFLRYCDKNCDAVSLHWYGDGTTYDAIVGTAQSWYQNMQFIRSKTRKPIYITEWNNHGSNGNINTTIGNALVNADIIGVFTRTGVAGYTFFGPIHGANNGGYGAWGLLYGSGEPKPLDAPTPAYFIFPLWTHMGNSVLEVTNPGDTVRTLSAYANKKDDGTVQVMLINKSDSRGVTIAFTGLDPAGKKVMRYELKSANGTPTDDNILYNGLANPMPATQDLPMPSEQSCNGDSMAITLPPYSITELDFLTAPDSIGLSISNFAVSPTVVMLGAVTTITFTAEASQRNGTITSAIIDLSAIGGSAAQTMGPGASIGKYIYQTTVPAGTTAGAKTFSLTVTDNAGNKRTAYAVVSVKEPKKEFIIYTDASSIAGFGWEANGKLVEKTSGGQEGSKYYDFTYTIATGYSGCGMLLYSWGKTLDPDGYKSIRFAYRGPASSLVFQYPGGATSKQVPVPAATVWTMVDLPISSFGPCTPIDCINIIVGGTDGTTGTIGIDNIRLVPENSAVRSYAASSLPSTVKILDVSSSRGCAWLRTTMSGHVSIFTPSGRMIVTKDLAARCPARLTLSPGVYLVSFRHGDKSAVRRIHVW